MVTITARNPKQQGKDPAHTGSQRDDPRQVRKGHGYDNRPAFDVFLLREDAGNLKGSNKERQRCHKTRPRNIETSLRRESPIRPVRIKRDMRQGTLATLLTNRLDLPGITVSIEPKRSYPYGNLGSHLFGHIGR